MKKIKFQKIDIFFIVCIFLVLILSIVAHDRISSILASLFGIIYTVLTGKKKPAGYIFGIFGTVIGAILAFNLTLFGNFMLHAIYYLPMEITGYINWNKHLNKECEVINLNIEKKELILSILCASILFFVMCFIFLKFKDSNPYLDSMVTILSILAMYYGVKRYNEQWIVWTIANLISIILWFSVFIKGQGVLAVFLVRIIYFILGIYFYLKWTKTKKDTKPI